MSYKVEFIENGDFTVKKSYLKEHLSVSVMKNHICISNTIISVELTPETLLSIDKWIEGVIYRYQLKLLKRELKI
jgi:hypothetical protein